ncbi:MAG TPA: YciI family protein [Pyrinomonadaceae bacterium]|nr:YciI family protein [Pyrinomonadaceae bacterium]
MKNSATFLVALLILALGVTVPAQQKSEPEHKLIEFHMALLKRGPKYGAAGMSKDLLAEHIANVMSLLESGKAVIAGPFQDDGDIAGVIIFRAQSADEARGWIEKDPAVKAEVLAAEMHPWWSEDVMKKFASPFKPTTAYIGFLTRGAKWTPEKTPATEELQKAHLANIFRLAETKKLVVAGPFGDDGTLRGIFVFKVASIDEARQLAETDPAVQAGRLAIEMHPWMVPEGVLP